MTISWLIVNGAFYRGMGILSLNPSSLELKAWFYYLQKGPFDTVNISYYFLLQFNVRTELPHAQSSLQLVWSTFFPECSGMRAV